MVSWDHVFGVYNKPTVYSYSETNDSFEHFSTPHSNNNIVYVKYNCCNKVVWLMIKIILYVSIDRV